MGRYLDLAAVKVELSPLLGTTFDDFRLALAWRGPLGFSFRH
jgi:hypothetical protein